MYSVDWAVKKNFQICSIETNKLVSIPPSREAFDRFFDQLKSKHFFYLEESGGDTFKLIALKNGHRVFTIPGKKVKEKREQLCISESDENSAKVIGILAKEHPEEFYKYQKLDITILKVSVLFSEYYKIVEDRTRKKNQLHAFKHKLELLTPEKEVKKVINTRKSTIKSLDKEVSAIQKQLLKLLKESPLWARYLKNIKGVGVVTAAGIIGSVKRFSRFPSKSSIRHFAGMIPKKGNYDYSRQLKQALYNFVQGIIKNKTPYWREMYDNIKVYYKEKHPDWKPGRVDAYAKKFVQTKFLYKLWIEGTKIESL